MNTSAVTEHQRVPAEEELPHRSHGCGTYLLPTSAEFRSQLPLTACVSERVHVARAQIAAILRGEDRRVLLLAGPCSIHDINAAVEYGERLKALSERIGDEVLLVMRAYFEKPRSVVGWKGLLYDTLEADGEFDGSGLKAARRLLIRLNAMGVPCATEFLNPILAPYVSDAVAYGSIGSRTVESQIHRELASGLEMPVGVKNGMDGDVRSAINAVAAASCRHTGFAIDDHGRVCLSATPGNPLAHVILRGGSSGPNYAPMVVQELALGLRESALRRPVVIDCSHGNSGKDHRRQGSVAKAVLQQMTDLSSPIAGLMLESNLVEGRQDAESGGVLRHGQSITDACIGWTETEALAMEIALQAGRHRSRFASTQ